MISTTTQNVIKELQEATLSTEDRIALVSSLLDKLGAFPIGDMVFQTSTGLSINGKDLDMEQQLGFKEAVDALKGNFARRVINEQLKYKATLIGIHKSNTIDELLFSKAILWVINEENMLLESLSGI